MSKVFKKAFRIFSYNMIHILTRLTCNLDAWAAADSAIKFERFYAGSPICSLASSPSKRSRMIRILSKMATAAAPSFRPAA